MPNGGPGPETSDYPGGCSVGQVADLTGVTVRTLHHYDEVGLLSPRKRSRAGYRLYDGDDVDRLMRTANGPFPRVIRIGERPRDPGTWLVERP